MVRRMHDHLMPVKRMHSIANQLSANGCFSIRGRKVTLGDTYVAMEEAYTSHKLNSYIPEHRLLQACHQLAGTCQGSRFVPPPQLKHLPVSLFPSGRSTSGLPST